LVLKKNIWKRRTIHSWSLNVLNMQIFKKHFVKFVHINFAINEKCSRFFYDNPNYLCFPCDLSNTQKCSFKECPLAWVAPLTMFLPKSTMIFTS
jgi:hypothetical protein